MNPILNRSGSRRAPAPFSQSRRLSTAAAIAALSACFVLPFCFIAHAGTTIDTANHRAYAGNLGWLDWRGDTDNGAVIGDYACSGNLYSANVGWINLGNGGPTNGIRYQNLSTNDFGVNNDGLGNLRGYAYAGNVGWLNFENTGAPKVDLFTGKLSGCVWSANCGWIALSNAVAQVQTDTIVGGIDSDGNGLPDAWELTYFGTIGVDPKADPDHDGMSNMQEYLAGTDPTSDGDSLRITGQSFGPGTPDVLATLTWTTKPTRAYYVQKTSDLGAPSWSDSGLGVISPDGATTARTFGDTSAITRFYRVQAVRPMGPQTYGSGKGTQ